jgi:hypothetical protein
MLVLIGSKGSGDSVQAKCLSSCLCQNACLLHVCLQGYGVIGSTAEGPEEIEHAPSVSITLASLPDVAVSITHVTAQDLPDGGTK